MTARSITLHVPNGTPVPVELTRVTRDEHGVELAATAPPEVWATIEGGLLLNLDSALDAAGELPPMLGADRAVSFTARLADAALADLAGLGDDELLEQVASAEPGSTLNDTESWFLAEARADGGEGFTTRFAGAGPRVRPQLDAEVRVEGPEGPPEPGRLLSLALSFLADAGIEVDVLSDTVATGVHEGANGPIEVVIHSRERAEQLLAYARWPEVVPEDRRAEVMELVTRINPQLPGAWLELDLDEGRVSARCTLNARGTEVADDTFAENVIWMAVSTMDEYLPAVRAVALEGLDVAAIHAAEAAGDTEDAEG